MPGSDTQTEQSKRRNRQSGECLMARGHQLVIRAGMFQ
jgi:hypothetical protein